MTSESLFEDLLNLRYKFSEYIPDPVINSSMGQPKFKVRNNWFQIIIANGEHLIERGLVGQKSERLYNEFYEWYTFENVFYRLKTREDINKGDRVLDNMISDLR